MRESFGPSLYIRRRAQSRDPAPKTSCVQCAPGRIHGQGESCCPRFYLHAARPCGSKCEFDVVTSWPKAATLAFPNLSGQFLCADTGFCVVCVLPDLHYQFLFGHIISSVIPLTFPRINAPVLISVPTCVWLPIHRESCILSGASQD